jgi:auxin efflux carrier family protein
MATSGLLSSFLAAIQASLSVLLVIFYGAVAARYKLLDGGTGKTISKICVRMFLPALLFVKIGSELHAESAHRYGIILIWALLCHLLSFFIGAFAHRFLGMADWVTVAVMFNNTTSYPLLLIQALDETGILKNLIVKDESTKDAIERAKSYFLVFATISSCLTFAVGPRLIDAEHAPEPGKDKTGHGEEDDNNDEGANENTTLLPPQDQFTSTYPTTANDSYQRRRSVYGILKDREPAATFDRRPSLVSRRRWLTISPRARWWLLFLADFLNAPLLGAIAGAVVGLVPVLHRSFFNDTQDGGIFTAWLTASIQTIGSLFVPLPVVIAGVSLYTSYIQARESRQHGQREEGLPLYTTIFTLVIRFIIWPVISIAIIYGLAKKTSILGTDPMLWFTMMLMPTGPSAMKLITMVQASDVDQEDEHIIAKLLTVSDSYQVENGIDLNKNLTFEKISYGLSPILAFTVVASLRASQASIGT